MENPQSIRAEAVGEPAIDPARELNRPYEAISKAPIEARIDFATTTDCGNGICDNINS